MGKMLAHGEVYILTIECVVKSTLTKLQIIVIKIQDT